MSFGARLKEERLRLGLKQAEFAALVGTDTPKQSLYENDRRELRARYLERLDPAGVDLLYVVTGRRSEGVLGEEASAFLAACLALPEALRGPVEQVMRDLASYTRSEGAAGSPPRRRPAPGRGPGGA